MQNLRIVHGFPVTQENAEQAICSLYIHISSMCMLLSTILYVFCLQFGGYKSLEHLKAH